MWLICCAPKLTFEQFSSDQEAKKWVERKVELHGDPSMASYIHPDNWLLDEHYIVHHKGKHAEKICRLEDRLER